MTGSFFQEATILESHGIDVQSPGGHSNSDDIDANDYNEQVRESNGLDSASNTIARADLHSDFITGL